MIAGAHLGAVLPVNAIAWVLPDVILKVRLPALAVRGEDPELTAVFDAVDGFLIAAASGLSAAPTVGFHASGRTAASDIMVLCFMICLSFLFLRLRHGPARVVLYSDYH